MRIHEAYGVAGTVVNDCDAPLEHPQYEEDLLEGSKRFAETQITRRTPRRKHEPSASTAKEFCQAIS